MKIKEDWRVKVRVSVGKRITNKLKEEMDMYVLQSELNKKYLLNKKNLLGALESMMLVGYVGSLWDV